MRDLQQIIESNRKLVEQHKLLIEARAKAQAEQARAVKPTRAATGRPLIVTVTEPSRESQD